MATVYKPTGNMKQIFTQFVSNSGTLLIGAASLLFIWGCTRALEWTWFRPRRLERELRNQGLDGTVYRFLVGDMKENTKLNKEACAMPMPLSHDITEHVSPLLHHTMKQYGKLSFGWFGPYPRVTIRDPELVKEVLYNKSGLLEKPRLILSRLLDDGLISYEGEKWAMHRKILNPAFHVEKLKRMLPAFYTCCHVLVDKWQDSVGPDGSFELDILPEIQNLTGDVISRAAFGSTYEEARQIFQLQSKLAERLKEAFTLSNPLSLFLPTKNNKSIKEINRQIRTLLNGMITKREEGIRKEGVSKDDLLNLMLEANMKEIEQSGRSDSSLGMTIEEVIKECKLFYFAGQETTSVLLTWAIVVLSMHPEWQEKAREEVLQHFGKEKPDYDGLNRLKIVTMILYEVLRLYPPVTVITRRICKTMQLGNITYPPGVLLVLPVLFIHHDPEIWGPDATEFNPTRFARGISKATKSGQVAFFPFGAGPRICIGQNFALLEAKMGLSMILQHFKFELSDQYQHAPYTVVTLQMEHGAPIKFHRI